MPGGLAAGQLVDERYALEEPLSEDSLGTVWRAFDRGLGREVVVRDVRFPGGLFEEQPARRQEALMAARMAIRLDHPGAVHVYDAFIDTDRLVIVTELVAGLTGRTLASVVERKGALPAKRVAAIGLDLLAPLEALHAMGLAHGALAPTGVLVPERGRAMLTELGLAPSFRDAESITWAHAAGTPSCLAPEQVAHEGNSAAADMRALGATLYYAVEAAHAFDTLDAVASDPPRPPSRAGHLWPVLERLLARRPEDRPTPEDIRAELASVAGVVLGQPEEAPGRLRRRERRRTAHSDAPPPEEAPETESPGSIDEHDWAAVVASDADALMHPATTGAATTGTGTTPEAPADGDPDSVWREWSPNEGPVETSDVWGPSGDGASEDGGDRPAQAFPPALTLVPSSTEESEESGAPETTEAAAAVAPAGAEEEEQRRFRSTPSWPPPEGRRGPLIVFLCALVMVVLVALLVTNGRIGSGGSSDTTIPAASRPVLATDADAVPSNWIAFRHARVDFGISYPPTWTVGEDGQAVLIRDPATGAELRIDYRRPAGPDPHEALLEREETFAPRQSPSAGYRRLQLSPASYLGHVAALWEYTYVDRNTALHVVDLNFRADGTTFTLNFRAPTGTWEAMLPVFHGFLSSVRPPD